MWSERVHERNKHGCGLWVWFVGVVCGSGQGINEVE